MSNKKTSDGKYLIFLCWFVYISSYLGRYSYNSNVTLISEHFNVSDSEIGIVSSAFFFAYGAGQIINGLLCSKYNKRLVPFLSLIVSSAANLAVFFGIPFVFYKYLWFINGIALSFLWTTFISILSSSLDKKQLQTSVVVMGSCVPIGTVAVYSLSALFSIPQIKSVLGYKYTFLVGAAVMITAGLLWLITYGKNRGNEQTEQTEQTESDVPQKSEFARLSKATVVFVVIVSVFAVVMNMVKDGLTTWVPVILKTEFGLNDSLSIIFTLVLPLFGFFGAVTVSALYRKMKSFIGILTLMFAVTAVCTAGMIGLLSTSLWIIIIILFGAVALSMYGANNVITSMIPMMMREKMNSGKLAGILNGFCYLGSTISGYCLGAFSDSFGWNGVFILMLCLCVLMIIISVIYSLATKNSER